MIYLLHFDRPFKHARHYIGWTSRANLEDRLKEHGTREGSALLYHVRLAGISWTLVRTWKGGPVQEHRLKLGSGVRQCPICSVEFKDRVRIRMANKRRQQKEVAAHEPTGQR